MPNIVVLQIRDETQSIKKIIINKNWDSMAFLWMMGREDGFA